RGGWGVRAGSRQRNGPARRRRHPASGTRRRNTRTPDFGDQALEEDSFVENRVPGGACPRQDIRRAAGESGPLRLRWRRVERRRDGMMVEVFREVAEYASAAGAVFLLEPLNRYEAEALNRIEQAAQIIQQIGASGIMVMADFFHMHIEESSSPAAIERVGGLI